MLVGQLGILRKALPAAMGLRKTSSLVICLCRLHNYCINRRLERQNNGLLPNDTIPEPTACDAMEIAVAGGVEVRHQKNSNNYFVDDFLHGGEHFDDVGESVRKQFSRRGIRKGDIVPRDKLLAMVERGGFQRKTPKAWLK